MITAKITYSVFPRMGIFVDLPLWRTGHRIHAVNICTAYNGPIMFVNALNGEAIA
jgi:hypothetical protein